MHWHHVLATALASLGFYLSSKTHFSSMSFWGSRRHQQCQSFPAPVPQENCSGLKFIQLNRNVLIQILLPLSTAITHPYLHKSLRSTSTSCTLLLSGTAGTVWHFQQKNQLHAKNLGKHLLSCTNILFVAQNWKALDPIFLHAIWGKESKKNNRRKSS